MLHRKKLFVHTASHSGCGVIGWRSRIRTRSFSQHTSALEDEMTVKVADIYARAYLVKSFTCCPGTLDRGAVELTLV